MKNYDYEIVKKINYLLDSRCNFLLNLLNEIRDYLVECKVDKSNVDIDRLLKMLD